MPGQATQRASAAQAFRRRGAAPPDVAQDVAVAAVRERAQRLSGPLSDLAGAPVRLVPAAALAVLCYRTLDPVRAMRFPADDALLARVRPLVMETEVPG